MQRSRNLSGYVQNLPIAEADPLEWIVLARRNQDGPQPDHRERSAIRAEQPQVTAARRDPRRRGRTGRGVLELLDVDRLRPLWPRLLLVGHFGALRE
jgi:hypothetical protein